MSLVQKSRFGQVHIPDNLTYPDLILDRATTHGNIAALIDATTDERMTYRELAVNIRRVSSSLYKRGLRKGDVTLIVSPNHILYPIALLGIGYIGGITATANPNYTPEELRFMVDDSRCCRIITKSSLVSIVTTAIEGHTGIKEIILLDTGPGYTSIRDLMECGNPEFISPVLINVREDVILLPYSSGTTGRSKGVMLTHYNIVSNVYQDLHPSIAIGPQPYEIFIAFLPFYHIYAMVVVQAIGLTRGDTIVVIEKYSMQHYLECIRKYKATFLHVVPPIALQLAKNEHSKEYMSTVHTFYCGAAPLGPEVEKDVLLKTGVPTFRQGYGLTETSPNTLVAPVNGWKHGACGMLIPNTECKIRDLETNEALGPDRDGELLFKGPQVMKGYWMRPQATADVFDKDGWFHTGDIGHYDADGHFYVIDRLKELIKWKGLQVPPADLEHVLLEHPAIADAAVVGIPDAEAGEIPRAYIVLKPHGHATETEIVQYVSGRVSPHKRLRGGVKFVVEIPKSPSGKILRRILKNNARDEHSKSKL